MRTHIQLPEQWLAFEEWLAHGNEQLEAICQAHPACKCCRTIRGIGPLSAIALGAVVNDMTHFENGRQLAAWLGLLPRQHPTGGKLRLLDISTRGDRYLRQTPRARSLGRTPLGQASVTAEVSGSAYVSASAPAHASRASQWRWPSDSLISKVNLNALQAFCS